MGDIAINILEGIPMGKISWFPVTEQSGTVTPNNVGAV